MALFEIQIDPNTRLALLGDRDAPDLFSLVDANRAYLRKWLPWVDSTKTIHDTRAFVREAMKQLTETQGFHAGIRHEGRMAGVIGFHRIDWPNRKVMIGYWLGPQYQGRGLMTRACRAMVEHAFDEFKLNRVEIHCAAENLRSRKIPIRLGFHEEGLIREGEFLYDRFVDLVPYRMLKREWRALHP